MYKYKFNEIKSFLETLLLLNNDKNWIGISKFKFKYFKILKELTHIEKLFIRYKAR